MDLCSAAIARIERHGRIIGRPIVLVIILNGTISEGVNGLIGGIELRAIDGISTGTAESASGDIRDSAFTAGFGDADSAFGVIASECVCFAMKACVCRSDGGIGGGISAEGDIAIIFSDGLGTDSDAIFPRGLAVVISGIAMKILNALSVDCIECIAHVIC